MTLLFITGTGRSGTSYLAQLLDIDHERSFTTGDIKHPLRHEASPFLHKYIDQPFAADWYIVHATREPRACIASLTARHHVFALNPPPTKPGAQPWREWVMREWPEVYGQPTPVKRATWFWFAVNAKIEQNADERVRVEDITPADVKRWCRIMDVPAVGALERLGSLPHDVNTRPGPRPVVVWSDLPDEVKVMAARYGYTP